MRMLWGTLVTFLAVHGLSQADGLKGDSMEDYQVTKDGRVQLRSEIVLKDAQGGIAGDTGKKWKIAPSGECSVVSFITEHGKELDDPPTRRVGKLSQDQILGLARVLAAQRAMNLSKNLGETETAEQRRITFKIGSVEKTARINSPMVGDDDISQALLSAADVRKNGSEELARFARATGAIQEAVQSSCR